MELKWIRSSSYVIRTTKTKDPINDILLKRFFIVVRDWKFDGIINQDNYIETLFGNWAQSSSSMEA